MGYAFRSSKNKDKRQSVLLALVLIAGFAVTISASTWQTMRHLNEVDEARVRSALDIMLAQQIATAETRAQSVIQWDDELADNLAPVAATHEGPRLFSTIRDDGYFESVWIMDAKGVPLAGIFGRDAARTSKSPPDPALAQAFIARLAGGIESWAGLANKPSGLAIISAARLAPDSDLAHLVRDKKPHSIFLSHSLTPDELAQTGALLQIGGLSFSRENEDLPSHDIEGFDGKAVARLSWQQSSSTSRIIKEQLPLTLGLASIFIMAAMLLLRRAQTSFRHLKRQARIDWLSQLPNRNALNQTIRAAVKSGKANALALFDLDSFKMVNDYHGHKTGDDLVRIVSRLLEETMPPGTCIARLGGDEFAALITGQDCLERLNDACEKFHARLKTAIQIGNATLVVSASIGIVEARDKAQASELLRRADLAMYAAKRAGKACSVIHDPALDRRSADNLAIKDDLVTAIREDHVELHYQPIIDASTGDVVAFEALARWFHPERGQIPAMSFIPIAEEFGLIADMGRRLLEKGCRDWSGQDCVRLTANISAAHIGRPEFAEDMRRIITESGFPPHQLEIEITETSLVRDGARARRSLEAISNLGVRIALDDFGSGYASIGFLQKFHFDMLKIDRSIVAQSMESASARSMLQACIAMAQVLGIQTTAEGIETAEQEQLMRAFGCDLLQGFYFARPMPLAKAKAYLPPAVDVFEQLRA